MTILHSGGLAWDDNVRSRNSSTMEYSGCAPWRLFVLAAANSRTFLMTGWKRGWHWSCDTDQFQTFSIFMAKVIKIRHFEILASLVEARTFPTPLYRTWFQVSMTSGISMGGFIPYPHPNPTQTLISYEQCQYYTALWYFTSYSSGSSNLQTGTNTFKQ